LHITLYVNSISSGITRIHVRVVLKRNWSAQNVVLSSSLVFFHIICMSTLPITNTIGQWRCTSGCNVALS